MTRTVLQMLQNAADRYGDKPYVVGKEEDGEWVPKSFLQIKMEARAFAYALLKLGIAKGDRIILLAQGSPRWVAAEFGILYSGAVSVPLSIQLLPEEIPFRVNHSRGKAVIVSSGTFEKAVSIRSKFKDDVFFIYLDNQDETYKKVVNEYSLEKGKDIFFFSELLKKGLEDFAEHEGELRKLEEGVSEGDTVTISYTSGTTGDPKGIMLSHLNYFTNCNDSIDLFNVPEGFSTLVILPCDHSFAHTVGIYAALLRGIVIYFVDSRGGRMATLRNIPINLKETDPSFLLTVPALTGNFMKKIIAGVEEQGGFIRFLFHRGLKSGMYYKGNGFNKPPFSIRFKNFFFFKIADLLIFKKIRLIFGKRIQFFVGGGALLDVKQQEFFYSLGIPVFQGYGLTEAAPVISSNTPKCHKLGTSGIIAPSVKCRILNKDGVEAEHGETGEIVIKGNNVMKGYYKNEKATTEAIKDGWLYTGDLGFFDEDDFLVVVGREKSLLIAEDGEKYSPEEIEEAIVNSSGLIHQVMLYNDQRRYTTALVTLDDGAVREIIQKENIKTAGEILEKIRESFYSFKDDGGYKNRFPGRWIPSTFQIIEESFSVENKMINSTMKMVRYIICRAYKDVLEYMYSETGDRYNNKENLNLLEKRFF